MNDDKITILHDCILNIHIEGIKTAKNFAEMWLEVNGNVVRSYTESSKHRSNWLKIAYAGDLSRGDVLSIKSQGIGEIQVSISSI